MLTSQKFLETMFLTVIAALGTTALSTYTVVAKIIPAIPLSLGLILGFMAMIGTMTKDLAPKIVSFTLFTFIVGNLLGLVVLESTSSVITSSLILTIGIMIFMFFVAKYNSNLFDNIGKYLGVTLIGLIILSILNYIFHFFKVTYISYISATLFTVYLGYDFNKALKEPEKTVSNAINSGLNVYLDLLNLFNNLINIQSKD